MAKKKKDPLAAAAQQVVKKTTDKVVKQTTQKRTAEQKVRSAAKGVAGNIVKNKAPGTVKSATKNRTAGKPFKASNISSNTGRSIKKQDRERTAKKYATMNQAKRTAKSNVTATQKGEKVMGGNAVQRNVLQKNKPTRLSRMDDFMLTDRGKNEVNNAKALYEVARRNNDEAGMKLAHGMAELARLNNQTRRRNDSGDIVGPYSGGTWGDRYIEANMGNFNTGQTGLREPEKNFLRSEAYQVKSALNEAGAGYLNTLREFPLRLPEGQGSSQLMIKGSDQDKYSSNVVDRRGQSRYTEEDMANKALEFQAASDAQRELGYQTTPINGFAGQFIGDATRVATGIGLDAAANAVVPGAGLVNMGARTWGTQVKQAKDEQKMRGTDKEPFADLKAYMYGTAMTGVEVATEKMFDGVKLFGKSVYGAGGATTKLGKMMDDVFNVGINRAVARLAKTPGGEAAISALMNIGKSGLEEGLEELVADFVQWQMPKIYGGDVEGAKEMLTGALYDFALGAAMGGFGGVTSTGSSMREAYLDRTNRNAETISDRMSELGADKEQAKNALIRMTIYQLESLAEASDETLTNVGREMGLISSQNENQSLTETSEEQRSEQTVEDGQPAISRSKAKDALRKRLRSMDIRDADRLRGIMDGLSAQEMDAASKMSVEDLSEWVEGRESGEITPAEPQAEPADIAEDVEEEDEGLAATPEDIRALGRKLEKLGLKGPEIARAVSDNATIDQLVNMDEEELRAWARELTTSAQPEALAEQTELLEAQRQERQEEAQAPATPLERSASVLGAAGRTAFVSSYNPSKRSDLYTAEAYRAYNAGFTGNARPTLYKTLNRASSEALYQAGVIDRQSSMRARENKKRNTIVFDKNTSELYWDENVERTIAAYSQAEGVRRFTQKDAQHLDRIVRALGKKAFFVESIDSLTEPGKHDIANGSYADGILKISLKTVDPISFTFGHEITHAMAEMSPKEYKRLERYVMGLEQSESQLAAIRKAYEDLKLPLSQETAIEEVVADYVGQMVTDLDLLERFARQVDRNVLQKFFDALRSLARKLTGKDKEDVNKAVKLVENMLSASVKQNKRMAKLNVSSEDILEGKAIVNSDTGEQYSIRASTFDINEGVMFEDLVNAEIMTQKEADELRENMSNLVREMIPYAHILDQNEEWSREDRPYSPLKPNSDPLYKISLDFTTLCRKRLLTQAIIERIQMEEKKAVSSDRQLKIRSLLQEYREIDNAVQVACGMCYVEAARLKSPKVINEFLKNPAPTVRNYFAKKDSGFEAWVKEQGASFKEEHGYSRTATKSEMSNTDREALNKMNSQLRKNYKLSTAQQEIMDKIKAMPPETFLSEANLTRLLVEEPVIYDIFISKVRAATRSKALQGPVPYYYGDSKGAISDRAIERMNAENGLRFQSWSDWQVQHLLDMMTAVIDLSVRGVKMHGYTKFPEEVRIFGNTGMQFNLSGVLGTVDPIINEDGTYSEDNFDSVEGVDIKEAKKVRDEFPDTAGIQCIGVSDAQILSLLNTDWVDYVIPYHSSGLNKALRKIAGIEKWEDYTKVQEAHPIDKKAEPGPGQEAENWHKEPAFSEFMVWDGENGLDCMRKSADRYVQLCEERGMVPKFNDLRTSGKPGAENYWKLLIDRKMINQKTGELIIQQAVRPNFNFKAMRDAIKREVDSYDPSRESRVFKYVVENGSKKGIRFSKEMKEKAASLGNTVIENVVSDSAETTPKYSARGTGYQPSTQRDADYMDAVQDGDMDTAQRLVDEAAKDAGFDSPKLYHGTNAFGFTDIDTKKSNDKISFFATTSAETAGTYSGTDTARVIGTNPGEGSSLGMYQLYANTDNLLELDAGGAESNHIALGQVEADFNYDSGGRSWRSYATAKQIAKFAKRNGYSGVIVRNVIDTATPESRNESASSDIYVFFDPRRQVKSADPVAYDDNGNIIPLSERFDPSKPDIRWSIRGGLTYDQMVERYGSIKPGERRARNIAVPKQTSDNTKVHQTIRTIMEAGRTPEDILPRLKEMIESGEFSYEVFGNREGVEYAQGVVADKGFAEAYKDWSAEIEKKIVSPQNVAMGWVLYDTAVENKDWDMVARISMQMAKYANTIGQGLQAMRILKMFSPEMQLAVMDGPKPERVRKKLEKRKQQEEQPADTYDEEEEEDDDIDLPGVFFGEEDEERPAPQKKPRKKPQRRTPREEQSDTNEDESDTEITQKDVEETAEYQARHSKSTLVDMWNSWRYLAMLFNARTHIRNIVGNLGFAPIVMSKNVTATAAEIAIYHTVGKHFGMKRTKGVYNPRMFAYAWKDFEQMRPTIMGEAKYEGQEPKPDEVVFRGILAPLEKARKLNSAALDLEDAWFSRPQYANALAQYMAANGITVEMMETGAGEITRGPHKGEHITATIMDEARAYAVKEAQKATYRDLNDLSEFFMRVGKPKTDDPTKVEKVVHVLIEGVIPFRKTPANILVRAMEYSPVGFAHGMWKLLHDVPATYHVRNRLEKLQQKIDAGEELTEKEKKFRKKASKFEPTTVAEALDRLCSGMSGTAIFALGMTLAKLGILVAKTDNGDDDQKYFSKLLGHQQWAIETPEGAQIKLPFWTIDVGGLSFTIDWLAPEVVPLFMGAQYFTGFNEGDPIRNFSSLADSLSMVIDPVLELSCMSGIQEALNNAAAFSEGDVNTMVGLASSLGLSYLSQGIPTLFGQLERASQAERMTTFTQDEQLIPSDWQYQIGKLSAKIPVWDYHQIPYVDSWGNTETETVLWKRIVANMFNPAYVKKIDTRDVNKELQRLYDATGDGDVLPKPGWKTYRYTDENGKNQTVYLTEEEYLAYGRAKGRNQFDLVSKFLKSNAYKNMSDPDRANVLDDIYYYSEYKAQKEYINNYKGEPYSWVSNYETFSNTVGGYDVADFIIVRGATRDVKGLYDPKKPGSNAISGTSACNKLLAIYNSGVHVPSDPAQREAFMEALDVAKTYRGYNKAQAEDHLNKTRKKYGITE